MMKDEKKNCIREDSDDKIFYENSFTRKTDFFLGHGGNLFLFLLYWAVLLVYIYGRSLCFVSIDWFLFMLLFLIQLNY